MATKINKYAGLSTGAQWQCYKPMLYEYEYNFNRVEENYQKQTVALCALNIFFWHKKTIQQSQEKELRDYKRIGKSDSELARQ